MLKSPAMIRLIIIPVVFLLGAAISGCVGSNASMETVKLKGIWHEVKRGDSISSLAARYNISERGIAELNDLTGDEALHMRREIFVPRNRGGACSDSPLERSNGCGYQCRLRRNSSVGRASHS